MPHYFFDSRDGDDLIRDDVGIDLPDLEAARFEATRALAEIASDVIPGSAGRSFSIEVRDQQGHVLARTAIVFDSTVMTPPPG